MTTASLDRRLSVAPMMDWTDRHDRYFMRLLTKRTLLYTEMVTTGAILHGDKNKLLDFSPEENPVALQLGGCDPADLAKSARIGESWGYSEINLNLGCPSDRVQNGSFGACLMAKPALVAECIAAMKKAVAIPVTAKTRIGIDDQDSYTHLHQFIAQLADAGCQSFTIHARKAILSGLSPKENREIPPLRYDYVYRLKQDFPHLEFVLNGGVKSLDMVKTQLEQLDGVMIGREAYQNPYMLAAVDREIFGESSASITRHEAISRFTEYAAGQMHLGTPLKHMTRHILGLFHGQPGGRKFRRYISEHAHLPNASVNVIEEAAALVPKQ